MSQVLKGTKRADAVILIFVKDEKQIHLSVCTGIHMYVDVCVCVSGGSENSPLPFESVRSSRFHWHKADSQEKHLLNCHMCVGGFTGERTPRVTRVGSLHAF